MDFSKEQFKLLCQIQQAITTINEHSQLEHQNVKPELYDIEVANNIPQEITANNPYRVEAWIHNAGDKDLLLGPVPDLNTDRYSIRIVPKDTLILNAHNYAQLYKGIIYGFWEAGVSSGSKVMVTEFSTVG